MRLIDANKLIYSISKKLIGLKAHEGLRAVQIVAECIVDAPTIEAKPIVHAHWIRKNNEMKCSNCEFIYYSNHDDFNFCPNCGAKMH